MKPVHIISLVVSIFTFAQANMDIQYLFLPQPREVVYQQGVTEKPVDQIGVVTLVDSEQIKNPQGYRLEISQSQVNITAGSAAGVYYGRQTLGQIIKQADGGAARLLVVNDWPDFAVRGVMLDISRDKVPTMETLYNLINMLASWKINEFQLYTEHTFAYKNHEEVWKDASPMTAAQIRELDAYCQERFIDLVPNQNSFGHMARWLKHERYRHLAEAPDYVDTKWGKRRWNTLYPAEPGSIALISEMYDELLPNFSSKYFNVGCDETMELGNGRSKELCEQIGTDRVYLDFLLKINALVEKHGKTMMFWADMIQHNPDIMKELPKDVVALIWGYDANHPFEKYCQTVASTGCKFYVCPGTSTWLSIAGRTDNAMVNLRSAAESGLKYGAMGFVNTDWGDMGNWEPITTSYLPYAYGAAISWALEDNKDMYLPTVVDEFAFDDKAGVAGKLFYDLGNAYKVGDVIIGNSSVVARLLLYTDWDLKKAPTLTAQKLEAIKAYTDSVMADIDKMDIQRGDAEYVAFELKHAADLIKHGCDLGIARFSAKDNKTANIPEQTRKKLAADLKRIMEDHKKVWLRRNREGGLSDSLSPMEELLAIYES